MYSEHARTFDHVMTHVTVPFKRALAGTLDLSCAADLVFVSRLDMDMDASALKKLHVKDLSDFLRGKGIPVDFCKAFEGIRSYFAMFDIRFFNFFFFLKKTSSTVEHFFDCLKVMFGRWYRQSV